MSETAGDKRGKARERILDAAATLFYERGINAVGVDAVIEAAGVAKMTLYRNFRSKSNLVAAYLRRRDAWWQTTFEAELSAPEMPPAERILHVFEVLRRWFESPDFHGCAYINADAERVDDEVHAVIAAHKQATQAMLERLAREAGAPAPEETGRQLFLLMEGCMVTARLQRSSWPADTARSAARVILGQALPGRARDAD